MSITKEATEPKRYFKPANRCPSCSSVNLSPPWESGGMQMYQCFQCSCHFGISGTAEFPTMPNLE